MNALKSLFSSIHNDKAIKQLEALGIQMYTVDAEGQKHFRNLHDVFMDLMITSHTTSQNMEKDLLAISGGKFQWSKVASVLGAYKDFLHAYTMSLDSTNFSQGQLEAQLDTITRKFEQLKATMTGIATGMGASGLSAYIKNILSSLNAFAQALQKIPAYVWKIAGGFVMVAGAIGSVLLVVKLMAAGIGAITSGVIAYTAAATAGTIATEGMAAAVTVATGGLNILLGLVVAAVAAFLGYNAIVSSNIEAINNEGQALEDAVQVKRQEIEMSEKQGELIETLCNNHVKLQEAINTTTEGTEQHKRAEEDLAATDQALTKIIGEDAMQQIDWNGDLQGSINNLKDAHSEKTRKLRLELAQSLEAQAAYQEAEQQRIEATITDLSTEGTAWTKLGQIIETVLHSIGSAMASMGRSLTEMGEKASTIFPSVGSFIRDVGNTVFNRGNSLINFTSEWSSDRADNAGEIAALKGQLANSKAASARARLEAEAIRGTGGESNPYAANTGMNNDSGIVPESESKDSGAGSKGKGGSSKSGAGAREADNSPEAMGYRYLTSKGLDKNMVLGLLGNIMQESGFNPDADNGSHRGLIQWDYDDASRTGRWYDFMDDYLANMRGISEAQYYAMDEQQKRALQYDFAIYEMRQGKEQEAYQRILSAAPTTPEQWASLINQHYERSGEAPGSPVDWQRQKNAREYASRFERKNGEDNYIDGEKAIENAYKEAKKLFDLELERLKTERQREGQNVSAGEELKLYEKTMGVGNGKNPYAVVEAAQKDYAKLLTSVAKEEAKRQDAIKKATDAQVAAIDKMADAEVAFAEKLGLMSKKDVRDYYIRKNERNYATQKPLLDAQLGATVDISKGSYDDMLEAYRGLIYAQNALEAEHYAQKVMYLSRDVDATRKALDEEMKLEESYQQRRQELEREAYEYNARYGLEFVDSFSSNFQSSLESMLNGTKSFGDALKDMFKGIVNDIIKMFTEDISQIVRGWLSKLFNRTGEEKPLGANPSGFFGLFGGGTRKKGKAKGGIASSGGDFGSLFFDSISPLGGSIFGKGKGKGGKGGKGGNMFGIPSILDSIVPKNTMQQVNNRMKQITSGMNKSIAQGWQAVNNTTQNGLTAMNGAISTGTEAMNTTWAATKEAQVATNQAGDAAIVAESETTAATVQATMAATMQWIMLVLALFSMFAGGGGESTSESTSSVNLGRSPDSYYMTPNPVMMSTNFMVPSFDIGGNIEQDMFAMVHKGEMVLTPEQADVIRSTAKSGGNMNNMGNANVKSNIQVSTVDSRGFDRVLRDYSRDLSKQVKKGIRNGYLTAKGLV